MLNASSGRSFVSEVLVPERVLTGAWPRTFRLALLDKDVGIATDLLTGDRGVDGPLLELAGALLAAARAALGEDGRLSRAHPAHRAAGRRGDSRLMPTCRAAPLSSVSVDPHGQSR